MKLEIKFTTQFKKDIKLAEKQKRNLDLLFNIVEKLANKETLESKYRDHNLSGTYSGCRECHIEPDFILVYEVHDKEMILMLLRIGTHSELFK